MAKDLDCVFCKIVAGQIPAAKVYEDAETLAFMDIGPVIKGHTLVIPKAHVESLADAPADMLARLGAVVQRIARAQADGLKADGNNVILANGRAAGQEVPHLHLHVVPRFHNDGHRWNWAQKKYDGSAEMEAVAARIRAAAGR